MLDVQRQPDVPMYVSQDLSTCVADNMNYPQNLFTKLCITRPPA
jgi:hypothetical protein